MAEAPKSSQDGRRAAERFLALAIQEWGQKSEERIASTQAFLDAAGFDAVATCAPVFGGILPEPMGGPDGRAATAWLRDLLNAEGWRGKFERERDYLTAALEARRG